MEEQFILKEVEGRDINATWFDIVNQLSLIPFPTAFSPKLPQEQKGTNKISGNWGKESRVNLTATRTKDSIIVKCNYSKGSEKEFVAFIKLKNYYSKQLLKEFNNPGIYIIGNGKDQIPLWKVEMVEKSFPDIMQSWTKYAFYKISDINRSDRIKLFIGDGIEDMYDHLDSIPIQVLEALVDDLKAGAEAFDIFKELSEGLDKLESTAQGEILNDKQTFDKIINNKANDSSVHRWHLINSALQSYEKNKKCLVRTRQNIFLIFIGFIGFFSLLSFYELIFTDLEEDYLFKILLSFTLSFGFTWIVVAFISHFRSPWMLYLIRGETLHKFLLGTTMSVTIILLFIRLLDAGHHLEGFILEALIVATLPLMFDLRKHLNELSIMITSVLISFPSLLHTFEQTELIWINLLLIPILIGIKPYLGYIQDGNKEAFEFGAHLSKLVIRINDLKSKDSKSDDKYKAPDATLKWGYWSMVKCLKKIGFEKLEEEEKGIDKYQYKRDNFTIYLDIDCRNRITRYIKEKGKVRGKNVDKRINDHLHKLPFYRDTSVWLRIEKAIIEGPTAAPVAIPRATPAPQAPIEVEAAEEAYIEETKPEPKGVMIERDKLVTEDDWKALIEKISSLSKDEIKNGSKEILDLLQNYEEKDNENIGMVLKIIATAPENRERLLYILESISHSKHFIIKSRYAKIRKSNVGGLYCLCKTLIDGEVSVGEGNDRWMDFSRNWSNPEENQLGGDDVRLAQSKLIIKYGSEIVDMINQVKLEVKESDGAGRPRLIRLHL